MCVAIETPAARIAEAVHARLDAGAALECDWCGRAVRRETAFERVQGGGDDAEVVVLCRECELGAD
jgi:hypothetical protein